MSNPATLVDAGEGLTFEAYLTEDNLDLRYGGESTPPLRLQCNLDARFFGDLILETGNVRSYETISLTQLGTDDIASFCSGAESPTEVARVAVDGSFETNGAITGIGTSLPFNVSETTRWGRMYVDATSSIRTLRAESSDAVDDIEDLDVRAKKVYVSARDETAGINSRWGVFKFSPGTGDTRILRIENGSQQAKSLTIETVTLILKAEATSGNAFRVTDSDASEDWFEVTYDGVVKIGGNTLSMDQDVDLSSLGGGNMATVASANSTAGAVLVHYKAVPQGSTASYAMTVDDTIMIIDAFVIKTSGAGTTGDQVALWDEDETYQISGTMSLNGVSDGSIVRVGSIDDAYHIVQATHHFHIKAEQGAGGNKACLVFVLCMRVAM